MGGPFWQQFAYEQLDGICPRCGSLHLSGSCSPPVCPGKEVAEDVPCFGAWMAVIRQRRGTKTSPSGGLSREVRKEVPASSFVQSGSFAAVSEPGTTTAPVADQSKSAQRFRSSARKGLAREKGSLNRPPAELKMKAVAKEKGKAVVECASVPVPVLSGKFQASETDNLQLINSNPFSALDLDVIDANVGGLRDACPGPHKRPRSVEFQAPRLISRLDKKKGKRAVSLSNNRSVLSSGDVQVNGVNVSPVLVKAKAMTGEKGPPVLGVGSLSDPRTVENRSQGSTRCTEKSPLTDAAPNELMCSQGMEVSTRSSESLPDCAMLELQGGSPDPTSC